MSKKIGIIGTGLVGKALATGFIQAGHGVMIGSRDRDKLSKLSSEMGSSLMTGSFSDTAKFGDIVVFTVKGSVAESALKLLGPDNLAGKVVIDTTNPIVDAPPVNGVLQFFTGPNESLMEKLQAAAPKAKFVKAWSCVGSSFMINPNFPGGPPTMFICGNDNAAKKSVEGLLKDFGWECEDMGSIEAARAIEPLCQLWCIPGLTSGRWTHAFKLLKM